MSAKGKLTRKELNSPDEFMTVTSRGLEWMLKNRTKLIGAFIALCVVAGGLWAYRHFSKRSVLKASEAFSEAMEIVRRPVKGDYGADETDELKKPFDTVKDRAKASVEKLAALTTEYKGTESAKLAQMYLGNAQLALEEADKAIEAFNTFLASKPKQDNLVALATENLGYAYEAKKDYPKAQEQFDKLATGKIYSERGLYHSGRLAQLQGNAAKAKELFQKAVDKAKEAKVDWFAQDVEARMGLLDLE